MTGSGGREGVHRPVAIVGAGPVGLALALGLARHGVRSVLVERKAGTSEHSKAAGVHVRTREVFRQWDVEDRVLDAGTLVRSFTQYDAGSGKRLASLEFSELDAETDRPGLLMLEQGKTERLLLEALQESGMCDIRFRTEATGLARHAGGATLSVRGNGETKSLAARYVVGCDGASSFVREALGLPFEGITYSLRPVIADVEVEDERDALPWPRLRNEREGLTIGLRIRPTLWRIIRIEGDDPGREDVPADEVRRRVRQVLGAGPSRIVWASRFRIHRRSSPRFRVGCVLLAGDAAHVHSPIGGLGMNAGIQDAHNLAWKLAAALRGGDEDRLLDSYEVERRAVVVANVSRFTDLLTRVFLQAPARVRGGALDLSRRILRIAPLRRRVLRRLTMIDLDYPPSPLLGRGERSAGIRLPNAALQSPGGGAPIRLYDLLSAAPMVLEVADGTAGEPALPVPPDEELVRVGPGGYRDTTGALRRLLGGKGGWILVRPDAHVAWARQRPDGLEGAIRRSLGQRTRREPGQGI